MILVLFLVLLPSFPALSFMVLPFPSGDSEAGWSHLRVQGYGLLTMVSGIAVVGWPVHRSITPYTVPVIISAGLFLGPWFTDIYGSFGLGNGASEAGITINTGLAPAMPA